MAIIETMKPRSRLAAILVLAAGSALSAGQAGKPSTDAPTFKVQVDYVEVDTVVTDRNGTMVRDLRKEDFQVFEDGKPQSISAFSLVDIPIERYERPLFASQPIEPDTSTNARPFDGRMYVAVIDDLHVYTGHTAQVKNAARQFIERRLGANDLMAVVHVGAADSASQDFTSNKRLLLAAVDRTLGRQLESSTVSRTNQYNLETSMDIRQQGTPVTDPLEAERADNARRTLDTLRDVARWFADVHGRRKAILFFSEGIDYDITDVFNHPNASLMLDVTRETVAAATRGNVSIYAIDPRGISGQSDETIEIGSFPDDTSLGIGEQSLHRDLLLSQASLRELGEETGGFAALNTNDFSRAFDRIVHDNSTYYVLAYYPPGGAKPGKVHTINVRVTRPGLTVRARKAYVTPKTAAPVEAKSSKNAPANVTKLMTPEIHGALDSPIPISGLTLHVFAAPFKGEAPNAAVMLGIDLVGRDLRLNTGDKVTVSYLAADVQGKIRGGSTEALTVNLRPETKTRAVETGFRLVNRLDLPPGRYQIRVAAHDGGGGNVGSVLYSLDVPDFTKGPLTMSGIALTSALGAAMPVAHMDEQLKAMMPVVPGASRAFAQNDERQTILDLYAEYGDWDTVHRKLAPLAVDGGPSVISEPSGDRGMVQ